MGIFGTDEEQVIKDNQNNGIGNGNISNVTLSDTADGLLILMFILTILKFIEIGYIIYTSHVRKIKKRYNNNNAHPSNAAT